MRAARAQHTQSGSALRAYLRLAQRRRVTGSRWWEARTGIIREAVPAYVTTPRSTLPLTWQLLHEVLPTTACRQLIADG